MTDLEKKEILETFNWIKVKKFVDDGSLPFKQQMDNLHEHHLTETTFLIKKIREIVRSIDSKKTIIEFEKQLENEFELISEAVADVVLIARFNENTDARKMIKEQFLVINRQDILE